jgi:alcohol dehydrogenase class IV
LQERYKSIFNVTNTKSINELCALIENLANKANLELNYAKLGININENMNLILDGINSQRLKNNPVEISVNELKKIIL